MSRTDRIDRLTPAQAALMPKWGEDWIRIGLSTERADRPTFERAARACYRHSGLEEPRAIVWVDSPMIVALAAPIAALALQGPLYTDAIHRALGGVPHAIRQRVVAAVRSVCAQVGAQVRDQVGAQVRDQVRAQVDAQVDAQVGAQVDAQVGAQVGAQVRAQVDAEVRDQVDAQVRDQVDAQVRAQVDAQVRDQVDAQVDAQVGAQVDAQVDAQVGAQVGAIRAAVHRSWMQIFGGQFWVGWWWRGVAAVDFFRVACGLDIGAEMSARADAYRDTCMSACWWAPRLGFVIASERPTEIHRDDAGRLHNPFGAAIRWPDGWGFWRIHGVAVPMNVIEDPSSVTVASIDAETNAEVRRIMVERYGTEKFAKDSGAQLVHSEVVDGQPAELYRRAFQDGTWTLALRVRNGTPEPNGERREFWLRPHPELRPLPDPDNPLAELGEPQELTCRNAVASTYGLRGEQYAPLERT